MTITQRIAELPDNERDRMIQLKKELGKRFANVKVNFKFVGMINGLLDQALSRDGRLAFYEWAFDRKIATSKDLLIHEMFALVLWAGPQKSAYEGQPWTYSRKCIADLPILIKLFAGGMGQMVMPLDGNEPKKFDSKQAIKDMGF